MSSQGQTVERARPRHAVLVFCALTTAATCAFVVMVVPRPVIPREPRIMWLDEREMAAVRAHDESLSGRALPDSPIDDLFRAHGHAELYRDEDPGDAAQRAQAIHITLDELAREEPEVRAILRADAARDLEQTLEAVEIDENLVGGFLDVVDRFGIPMRGESMAFAVRTLFKARWNAIAGASPTDGFAPVEIRAYHGALAFEAPGASADLRLARLVDYERETGEEQLEMRAYLYFAIGDTREAQALYERLYERTGQIRYRNHALAAIDIGTEQ